MISAHRLCPKCGAQIPSDAPEEGCPGCLLENGLGLLPDAEVADCDASTVISTKVNECDSAENVEVNAGAAARQSKEATHAAKTLGELCDSSAPKEADK
jgi:hypothetical protein